MANETPVRFYNFWNAQTFHFFQWVMHSGMVPIDALIDRAWEMIETGEDNCADGKAWFDMSGDASTCLCDELAGLLKEVLENAGHDFFGLHKGFIFGGIEENGIADSSEPEMMADADVTDLFAPILMEALRDIQFEKVAQAVLMAKGKWAPEK